MAPCADGRRGIPAADTLLLLLAATATLTVSTRQTQAYKYLEGALIETMDMKPFIGDDREGHVCYEADVVFDNETTKTMKKDTPKRCQNSCSKEANCYYWSWDSVTQTCHHKGPYALHRRERSGRSQGYISGPKRCTMPHPMRCYEIGVAYQGHLIEDIERVDSPFSCHEKCLEKDNCMYWTWYGGANMRCSLSHITALEGWTRDESTRDAVSGMRSCGPCVELGVDYRGHDVERISNERIPVAEECRRRCMRHPGCFFWTWVRSHKGCYLKGLEALNGRLQDELTVDMVSGSKFCPMDRDLRIQLMNNVPWASRDFFRHSKAPCYEQSVAYTGQPETTINDLSVKCAHDCHMRCRKVQGCEYWTYDTSTYECELRSLDPNMKKKRDDNTVNKISGTKDCPCPDEELEDTEL